MNEKRRRVLRLWRIALEECSEKQREEINSAVNEAVIRMLKKAGYSVIDPYQAAMIVMEEGIDITDIVADIIEKKLQEFGIAF